jgi:hypothetical protein
MMTTLDNLRERYNSLLDEELARIYINGSLTKEAELALEEELSRRGIPVNRDELTRISGTTIDRAPTAGETARAAAPTFIPWLITFAIFVIGNLILATFAEVAAPLIWNSEADRFCQNTGHWYARTPEGSNNFACVSWWLRPRAVPDNALHRTHPANRQ